MCCEPVQPTACMGIQWRHTTCLQTCIVDGKPLKSTDYQAIQNASKSYGIVKPAIPKIAMLSECEFVDRAFEAIVRKDCGDIKDNTSLLFRSALLAGFGLTLASFLFCACFAYVPVLRAQALFSLNLTPSERIICLSYRCIFFHMHVGGFRSAYAKVLAVYILRAFVLRMLCFVMMQKLHGYLE
jgi:hypothetical protein